MRQAIVRDDPRLLFERALRIFPPIRLRRVERGLYASDLAAHQILGGSARRADRDVGLALRQAQECVVHDELQPNVGIRSTEVREHRHQQAVHQRVRARDANRSGRAGVEAGELSLRAVDQLGNTCKSFTQLFARGGDRIAAWQTLEQTGAEIPLQRCEPPQHGRVAGAQVLRGSGDRAVRRDR